MPAVLRYLQEKYRQNLAIFSCSVSDDDYIKIAPQIELLERLAEVENNVFTVFDMNRKNYLLKSYGFKRMLGYSTAEDLENDDMELFLQLIHPADLPFVLETQNKVHEFFRCLPVDEKKDYKLVYDFRVKNTSGVYMHFLHQLVVLEQDATGSSWLLLVVTNLISEKAQDIVPRRRMIHLKTGNLFLFRDDDEFQSKKLLTRRETEVLGLITQGLDSQQIAGHLFISVNTVNNHRQKILRKTKTGNTTQAILYCKKLGII